MFSTRLAVSLHILILIATASNELDTRSDVLAAGIGTNPVVVRRHIGDLSRAGLARARRGRGGAYLARTPDRITLLDVFKAIESRGAELPTHDLASGASASDRRIKAEMEVAFGTASRAIERTLESVTLAELLDATGQRLPRLGSAQVDFAE
jgi:DNA-binding IscR family transcriptional regulator